MSLGLLLISMDVMFVPLKSIKQSSGLLLISMDEIVLPVRIRSVSSGYPVTSKPERDVFSSVM